MLLPNIILLVASMGASSLATPVALETRQEDQATMLSATNSYRTLHSADPLTWNNTLATYAAEVAASCDFAHSNGEYGENLAAGSGDFTDQTAVDLWYAEEASYDYSNPGFSSNTGHFTQLVWQATTQVGCARQFCNSLSSTSLTNSFFIVCEYFPPGNVNSAASFQANVSEN